MKQETPPARLLRPGAFCFLQLDRVDFGDEPSGVVTQVRDDHVEHGVTEAANVQAAEGGFIGG